MDLSPVHTPKTTTVLSVSKRIILDRYWHFVTLSMFFIPLTFSLIIIPTFHPSNHQNLLILYLIIYVLAICATGTITYSTHHTFIGSPVNISDALKSLTSSFFPLASTAIIAHVLTLLISLTFIMFVGTILMLVHKLWFVIDYNSTYFMLFSATACVILVAIIIYFNVEWSLAFVVVVVESKWGFAALMRSMYLVKGMKLVSLLVMLYFGVCGAIMVCICVGSFNDQYRWWFVFNTMLASFFLMMMLLRITAANTVLYNYCKALHGELEIEGFDHEYMSLPVVDDKARQVVTIIAV